MSALKRVERWLSRSASSGWTNVRGDYLDVADLREVVRLAKLAPRPVKETPHDIAMADSAVSGEYVCNCGRSFFTQGEHGQHRVAMLRSVSRKKRRHA